MTSFSNNWKKKLQCFIIQVLWRLSCLIWLTESQSKYFSLVWAAWVFVNAEKVGGWLDCILLSAIYLKTYITVRDTILSFLGWTLTFCSFIHSASNQNHGHENESNWEHQFKIIPLCFRSLSLIAGILLMMALCEQVHVYEYIPSMRQTDLCHYHERYYDAACTLGAYHPLLYEKSLIQRLNTGTDSDLRRRGRVTLPGLNTVDCDVAETWTELNPSLSTHTQNMRAHTHTPTHGVWPFLARF